LRGRRFHDHLVELPVFAVVREAGVRGPGTGDDRQRFLVAGVGFVHRDAEPGKLVVPIAAADAEIEPAAG